MARTIVNKHFDDSKEITRKQFHENLDFAKGEIIISNEENPSIWVLDTNGKVKQITGIGGGSGGNSDITSADLAKLEERVTDAYTKADNDVISGVTLGYEAADTALKTELISANETFKDNVNLAIATIKEAYKAADATITQTITTTKEDILAHTVNGELLKNNPVLDATHISVGTYSELVLNKDTKENVITNDTTQTAIKKVENMNIASSLAFAAGMNDINGKVKTLFENEDKTSKTLNELDTRIINLENYKIDDLILRIVELEKRIAALENNVTVTD